MEMAINDCGQISERGDIITEVSWDIVMVFVVEDGKQIQEVGREVITQYIWLRAEACVT